MGSVIKLYAFTILLERLGVVNTTLQDLHLTSQPLSLLYTQFAVVIGMVYQLLPYSVLPLYVAFLTIDLDLLLAAEGLGASRARALLSVVVPLGLPGILATVTIVYVICLGFYLTPVILGGATAPFTASLISSDLFTFFDSADAAIAAIFLLIGAILVVAIGYGLVGKDRLKRAIA
jgi:putative spermidine/putrescine transport system permease protein